MPLSLKRAVVLSMILIVFVMIMTSQRRKVLKNEHPSLTRSTTTESSVSAAFDTFSNLQLNFERRSNCHLNSTNHCDVSNKSLVITFWGQRSVEKWLITNLLSVFVEGHFDYLIMIYDNSSWITHPAYNKAIWIHVHDQIRFWFVKRFVSPEILRNYRYIWIVDDDARFHFHPLAYQCVADRYHLLLSSPGRLTGSISHLFTRISPHHSEKIGRWTDFVETGPLVIFNSSALACLWHRISEKVSTGFGLDLIWCQLLRVYCFPHISPKRICSILDSFAVDHLSDGIYTIDIGTAELPAYHKYDLNYQTKKQIFGSVDRDSTVGDRCVQTFPFNQSLME